MKQLWAFLFLVCTGLIPGTAVSERVAAPITAPVLVPGVLRSVPHDPTAFTQGFFFHEGQLYESGGGYGDSFIAWRDPGGGLPHRLARLHRDYFGEGATCLGDTLYWLTWREQVCLMLDPCSLEVKGTFRYQGEGWGLTQDGSRLIRSDGSDSLWFHAADGTFLERVRVTDGGQPVHMLNELEWDPVTGLILANIWLRNRVAAIDPRSGVVRFWLDLEALIPSDPHVRANPDAVPNGLAIAPDGESLWITGKLWPLIQVVRWPPEEWRWAKF